MRPYKECTTILENTINAKEYNGDTEELGPHQQSQTKILLDVGGRAGTEERRGENSVGPIQGLLWIPSRGRKKMESPDLVAVGAMTDFPGRALGGDHPQSMEAIWHDWKEGLSRVPENSSKVCKRLSTTSGGRWFLQSATSQPRSTPW